MAKETSKETIELVHSTHGDIDFSETIPGRDGTGTRPRYNVWSNGTVQDMSNKAAIIRSPPKELQTFNASNARDMAIIREQKKQQAIEAELNRGEGLQGIARARITVASDPDAGHAGVSSAEWVMKHGGYNAQQGQVTLQQGEHSITASEEFLLRFLNNRAE